MTTYDNVSTRALLVSLNISTWSARKFDRKATDEVAQDNAATTKAGRYNKHLLAGAQIHRDVLAAAGAARRAHYLQTLPWGDEGQRLLPTANYQQYVDAMRAARTTFDAAVAALLANYATLQADARRELGHLYDPSEYPTAREVREKFGWAIEFSPVPSAGDIRVALPDDEVAAIESRIESRVVAATRDAMADAWGRLHEAVARIAKATETTDGIIRGNLIDNVRQTADILGRLNVAQDADLDAMRARVLRELATVDVNVLREDDAVRVDTKAKADSIIAAMGDFFGSGALLQRADAGADFFFDEVVTNGRAIAELPALLQFVERVAMERGYDATDALDRIVADARTIVERVGARTPDFAALLSNATRMYIEEMPESRRHPSAWFSTAEKPREDVDAFNLTMARTELNRIAPELLDELREYVTYGLCRQGNAAERKSLAEQFRRMANATLKRFPDLKLTHVGAKTRLED